MLFLLRVLSTELIWVSVYSFPKPTRHHSGLIDRAAMRGGDRAFATAIALRLAAASFSPSWDVAAAVVEAADATDATGGDGTWRPPGMDARAGLLSFALARCSPERMPDLLASWQQLEAARLVANAGVEPPRFADAAGGPLDEAPRAALVRAAPTLTQAHAARPRPRLRALAAGPLPSLLAAATSGGEDDRARDARRAAATALAYSLCLQDVAPSDEILAPLAVNAAVASAVDAPPEEPLDDMRVPSWAGPALGFLIGLDSPDSVGKCVDALSVAKGVDELPILVGVDAVGFPLFGFDELFQGLEGVGDPLFAIGMPSGACLFDRSLVANVGGAKDGESALAHACNVGGKAVRLFLFDARVHGGGCNLLTRQH